MFQWLLFLALLYFIFFPTIGFQSSLRRPMLAERYIRAVHPYSGLDPETWENFKKDVRAFEVEEDVAVAAQYLASALENIRNLGLSIRRADDGHIQEELDALASKLAIDGEYELYTSAKKKGVYFFPRYLNEIRDETPGNDNDFKRGATVGDPGTHFPAPRRGGGDGSNAFGTYRQTT